MASAHLRRDLWVSKLGIEDLWDVAAWLEEVNLLSELAVMDVTKDGKKHPKPTDSLDEAGECADLTAEFLKKSEVVQKTSHVEVAEAKLVKKVGDDMVTTAVVPVLSSWQELQVAELRSKEALKKRLETQVAILHEDIQQMRQDLSFLEDGIP